MVPGTEGGITNYIPENASHAHLRCGHEIPSFIKTPLVVFAGKEYGTGSSRDWAAKGSQLLGIRAVDR
jgi:aconitate hydratase